jgi:acyl-CoA hydrolase
MSSLPHRAVNDALARIPTGAHLVCTPGMGEPGTLLAALAECASGRRWTLSSGLLLGDYPFLPAVLAGELAYRTWHVMPPVRDHVARGAVAYIPARASRIEHLLHSAGLGAALVRVSPPDAAGFCSLGGSTGYGAAAIAAAPLVIAEIDPAVPRTCGDSTVHVSVFDSLVESSTPIPTYVSARSSDIATAIAGHVRGLLPTSPTLQIGVGAIPETLVRSLADGLSDLGTVRFVGMATDNMVDLFAAGVLRADQVGPQPAVLSPDMMATERLLKFADENPAIEMHPSSLAHDAAQLGRIERFVSINTAIEVDLAGNVNSEVLNGRQLSGPGGSLDYIDAATRSAGGRRIIALPATNGDGSVSRIVPSLASVSVPRSMVDVVVTEYGVAELEGRSLRERAEALTEIAHPDHRDQLRESAR